MPQIEIKTQAELDAAIAAGQDELRFVAKGRFEIRCGFLLKVFVSAELRWDVDLIAWGSSRVVAWESSRVEAWGSSSVVARESSSVVARESSRVVARESSSVVAWESSRVEAWGSSSVVARESSRVEAWGSSRVEAWGSSRVVARESSSVVAIGFVAVHLWNKAKAKLSIKCHVHIHSKAATADGGVQTDAIITTAKDWCESYGLEIKKGVVVLYKGLHEDFSSRHDRDFKYTPGTTPKAANLDVENECGRGLHFSPHPRMTKEFHPEAVKFVGCPVKVKDLVIHPDGQYPQKAKALGLCAPCFEVDEDGAIV